MSKKVTFVDAGTKSVTSVPRPYPTYGGGPETYALDWPHETGDRFSSNTGGVGVHRYVADRVTGGSGFVFVGAAEQSGAYLVITHPMAPLSFTDYSGVYNHPTLHANDIIVIPETGSPYTARRIQAVSPSFVAGTPVSVPSANGFLRIGAFYNSLFGILATEGVEGSIQYSIYSVDPTSFAITVYSPFATASPIVNVGDYHFTMDSSVALSDTVIVMQAIKKTSDSGFNGHYRLGNVVVTRSGNTASVSGYQNFTVPAGVDDGVTGFDEGFFRFGSVRLDSTHFVSSYLGSLPHPQFKQRAVFFSVSGSTVTLDATTENFLYTDILGVLDSSHLLSQPEQSSNSAGNDLYVHTFTTSGGISATSSTFSNDNLPPFENYGAGFQHSFMGAMKKDAPEFTIAHQAHDGIHHWLQPCTWTGSTIVFGDPVATSPVEAQPVMGTGEILVDSSGNGNDGTYGFNGNTSQQTFVPGLVSGDFAVRSVGFQLGQVALDSPDPFAGSFSVAVWVNIENTLTFGPGYNVLVGHDASGGVQTVRIEGSFGTFRSFELQRNAGGPPFASSDQYLIGNIPYPPGSHFIVWTYDATTDLATVYFDGVVFGSTESSLGPHSTALPTRNISFTGGSSAFPATYDELAIFSTKLTSGNIANLFTAASASFSTYTAAVLANNPIAYYHFSAETGGTGLPPPRGIASATAGAPKIVEIGKTHIKAKSDSIISTGDPHFPYLP